MKLQSILITTEGVGALLQYVDESKQIYRYPNNPNDWNDLVDNIGFKKHLYLWSNGQINKDDYFECSGRIQKALKVDSGYVYGNESTEPRNLCKKIEFTTDPKLIIDKVLAIDENTRAAIITGSEDLRDGITIREVNFFTEFCKRWNDNPNIVIGVETEKVWRYPANGLDSGEFVEKIKLDAAEQPALTFMDNELLNLSEETNEKPKMNCSCNGQTSIEWIDNKKVECCRHCHTPVDSNHNQSAQEVDDNYYEIAEKIFDRERQQIPFSEQQRSIAIASIQVALQSKAVNPLAQEVKPVGYLFNGRFYKSLDELRGRTMSEDNQPIAVYTSLFAQSKAGGHMEDRIIKIDFCGHLNGEIIVKDNCIVIKNVTNAFVDIVNENEIKIQSLKSTPLQTNSKNAVMGRNSALRKPDDDNFLTTTQTKEREDNEEPQTQEEGAALKFSLEDMMQFGLGVRNNDDHDSVSKLLDDYIRHQGKYFTYIPLEKRSKEVEFAEWITQSVWNYYDEKGKLWTNSDKVITTEELFQLFLTTNPLNK